MSAIGCPRCGFTKAHVKPAHEVSRGWFGHWRFRVAGVHAQCSKCGLPYWIDEHGARSMTELRPPAPPLASVPTPNERMRNAARLGDPDVDLGQDG